MSLRAGTAVPGLGALLLAALLGGCGDAIVTPPDAASTTLTPIGVIGSVTVTGAPEGLLAVGSAVQLEATVIGSTGTPVTGTVKWRSTDSTVARVSATGLVTTVRPGPAAIIAASGRAADTATVSVVPPPATLTVSSPYGAMYVGQLAPLAVTARDTWGYEITGLYIKWTSSDPQKLTVDAAGKATAVAVGPATVTAAAGSKSASAPLPVVVRPTAEWSQGGTWGTFQGNARHTGHVAVSADPLAFRPLWDVPVAPGGAVNPVVAGDGKVFVTTAAYFGSQVLSALDVRTGGKLWSRDFGDIHGVHPPAYGGGRVYVTTSGHQDSFLWGFDASTGVQGMKSPYGNQWSRYFAPVVADGRVHMAGGYYGGMYTFRTSDGGQAWFVDTSQYDEWTPAVDGGLVYAYTGSYSPRLTVANAATGAVAYEIPDPSFSWNGWSMYVAPVLGGSGNVLATQAGRLISFDLAGRRVGWQLLDKFAGGVTVADGVLYVVNNGRVEARRESSGALLWSWTAPDGAVTGTTIATRNLLFVSTGYRTYAIDLAARQHTWSHPVGGALALSGADGMLLIAGQNGNVATIALR